MGQADDDDHEMSPQAADAVMGTILWGMFGLEEDERPLCDEARIDQAVEQFSRKRSTTSIKGDEMSWGLWCLRREGLRARVERAVQTAGVPAWILGEAESWSDDELRAWLARHEARELEKNFAQADEQSRIRREAQRARLARGARVVLVVGGVERRDAIRQLVAKINREQRGRDFEVFHIRRKEQFGEVPLKVRESLACIVIPAPPSAHDVPASADVPRVLWIGRRVPYDILRYDLQVGRDPDEDSE